MNQGPPEPFSTAEVGAEALTIGDFKMLIPLAIFGVIVIICKIIVDRRNRPQR